MQKRRPRDRTTIDDAIFPWIRSIVPICDDAKRGTTPENVRQSDILTATNGRSSDKLIALDESKSLDDCPEVSLRIQREASANKLPLQLPLYFFERLLESQSSPSYRPSPDVAHVD